jgi:hypothetical protein
MSVNSSFGSTGFYCFKINFDTHFGAKIVKEPTTDITIMLSAMGFLIASTYLKNKIHELIQKSKIYDSHTK